MKEFSQLLKINKQIFKLEQLHENKESFNLLLEDLYEKEQNLFTFFQKDYNCLEELVKKLEENLGIDLNRFSLINLIEHTSLPIHILSPINLLQNIWEFVLFQDFSALNFWEVLSVKDMPYFKNYLEAFLEFKDWEYTVAQTLSEMIESHSQAKKILEYFLYKNTFQKISGYHNSEKALEFKLDALKQLYQEVVRYDIRYEKHEELKMLFEACLKNIPSKNLIDVYNELQANFYNLDLANVYPDYFHEMNTLFIKYKVGILEETPDDEFEMEMNQSERLAYIKSGFIIETYYSYKDILLYNQKFLELEKIGLQILHIYQKLINCKLQSEKLEYKNYNQKSLTELLEKEKKLYKNIDLVEFQNYLKVFYTPEIDYFPFGIVDILSSENSEKELVFHRMVNYEINKDNISTFSPLPNSIVQVLDKDESEVFDANQFQTLLLSLTYLVLGKITKEEFIQALGKIGTDYEEQFESLKEEQIALLWQYIEKNYLNILLQNGEQELVWYYMFVKNKEMEYLVQKDFNCMLTINNSFNEVFYPVLRRFLIDDLQRAKEEISNSVDVRKKKLFSYYLESCLTFFKDKDKAKFQKIREIVRKK